MAESQLLQLCTNGNLSSLKDFITEQRLNPNEVKDSSGLTLLHLACQHGHLDIVQYLNKDQKCSPETTTPNGHTPLHIACKSGHLHIAKILIADHKCNPHCTDNDGYTPLHAASESGNIETVKYLITEQGCDPQVSDSIGNTPLHYASESGHLDIVQCLITDFNCDPQKTNTRGSIPMHYACRGGHVAVARYLIDEHHCSPNCTINSGNTSLHLACLSGHLAVVKYLIDELGCNPQIVNKYGRSPLHLACLSGHLDMIKYLVSDCNCNTKCSANNADTLLHFACKNGHVDIAKYLITERKCSPEHRNVEGCTPLHAAASNGHLAVVKYLIRELGCNPEIPEYNGLTPLHYACMKGHLHVTKYLISDCKCNPEYLTNGGVSPLKFACQNGHLEVIKYLISEHKCNPAHGGDVNGYTLLHSAASNDHLVFVKYLIDELGCNPQIADNDGYTPLHYACLSGHLDITKYLISVCRCNPEYLTNGGVSPLQFACGSGHLEVAKYLISEHKCNPEHGTVDGYTPLHFAAGNGHLDVVKYLVSELGCNPEILENSGLTPLHYACQEGHLDIIEYLMSDRNCINNPHCSTYNGNIPLHFACQNGHLQVVKYLITEHKCSPEHGDVDGSTPLHYAARNGHLAVVKYLISDLGCSPQIPEKDDTTPLHYACLKGHLDITKYLISDCNCNPECSDKNGLTPLHCACENGHLEVAKYLITEHKCSPEHGNVNGFTPLHSAVRNGHLAVVKYLISEGGCNPQITDNGGLTPLHCACLKGRLHITKYLISDCNCNPEYLTNEGVSPLIFGCQNGHLEVIKYLISEHKCSPEHGDVDGYTPLHSAASNGHLTVVKYLIGELGCDSQITDNDGYTPLHAACLYAHLAITKYLILDCRCNPQSSTNNGRTPLHCACLNGHLEVAEYLITEHKCNPEHGNVNDITPLHLAASNGHLAVVRYLITKHNCNPQCCDPNGFTPLHLTCHSGHLHVAKYLIHEQNCAHEPEARIDSATTFKKCFTQPMLKAFELFSLTEGVTPLHLACMEGHLDIVKYLIDVLKCNPNHSTSNCLTAIDWAQLKGHQDVVSYLKNRHQCSINLGQVFTEAISNIYGVNSDHFFQDLNDMCLSPLDVACMTGDLEAFRLCTIEYNCNQSSTGFLGITPLQRACIFGQLEIAKSLITEHNCSPEHGGFNGHTPLHYAAYGGHLAVVKYLITQHNCDPQCTDIDGTTPLHIACFCGHLLVVKYLICEQKCGYESEAGISQKTIKYLLPHIFEQIETELKVFNGITPLHFACMRGHLYIVQYLLDVCNCNPHHSTSNGFTAIDFAQLQGHQEVVSYLGNKHQCSLHWGQVVSSATSHFLCNFHGLSSDYLDLPCIDVNDVWVSQLQRACVTGNLAAVKHATESDCKLSTGFLGHTPLHTACMMGHLEIAKYLVTECECDPRTPIYLDDKVITPLFLATVFGQLEVVRWLVSEQECEPKFDSQNEHNIPLVILAFVYGHLRIIKYLLSECNSQDLDFICLACCFGHMNVVKYLVKEHKCNPHIIDDDGITLLHIACASIQYFEERERNTSEVSTAIYSMQGILHILLAIINLPVTLVSNILPSILPGFFNSVNEMSLHDVQRTSKQATPYNLRCLDIVKYLITEHNCNPQCRDKEGQTPLHYACAGGQLEIVQYFHSEKLSDLVHTTHSGDTPLHFSCKYNQVEVTQFLLSTGECNPLIKNTEGQTPVEIAASPEIRKLLDHFCKGSYPLESVVKVFVLGDPMAGKSSLVQAIRSNPGFLSSLIGQFQRVKGVRQQTVGIDSFSFSSSDFGNVVIYDFAGQREFYTSHAAFLQTSLSYVPGIFILVVNIAECEDTICQSLQYWVSFVQECCAHMCTKMKISLIIIGSHVDQLDIGSVEMVVSITEKYFVNLENGDKLFEIEGVICLDCTRQSSPGLDLLRRHLEESCNSIRENTERIDQRCYVLHKYFHKAYIHKDIHGRTLENITIDLEDNPYLLPRSSSELLPLLQTLHDKGQIILLKNDQDIGSSWVITNIPAILETVVGSIFAPRDFTQHIAPGSTGIVPKSRISEAFSAFNIDMIIGFLEHFEFCHQVGLNWVIQSKHEVSDTNDEYYLFPALVTLKNIPQVLHESHESHYYCGWFMHSTAKHQFFTIRLLHVLLLRLAFQFALPQDNVIPTASKDEAPALKRSCTMWKSGITWHNTNGVSTHFEVRELKTVILIMSSMKGSEIHCVRLRTQLIKTILKTRKELCPRVDVEECIMEVGNDRFAETERCPSQCTKYSLKYISDRISTRNASDHQDLVLVNPDGSPGKQISELLYFEPYTLLTPDLITQMFSRQTSSLILSDAFLSELAAHFYLCKNILSQILTPNPRLLSEKLKMNVYSLDSLDEMSKHLKCVHILEAWMEQQESPATYRKLRQELNKYSIFCGRNPLDLTQDDDVDSQHQYSSHEATESIEGEAERENESREDESSYSGNQSDRVTLMECVRFRGRERRINIPQEIGIKYHDFGLFLLEDDTGTRVRSIAHKHRNDAEQINMEVFRQWISGRGKHPITWKTLVEVLRDIELNVLAGEIEVVNCHQNTEVEGVIHREIAGSIKRIKHHEATLDEKNSRGFSIGVGEGDVQRGSENMITKCSEQTCIGLTPAEDAECCEIADKKVDIATDMLGQARSFEANLFPFDLEVVNLNSQLTSISQIDSPIQGGLYKFVQLLMSNYNEALQQIADIAADLPSKCLELASMEKHQMKSALHRNSESFPTQGISAADVTKGSEQKGIVDEALQQIADITENLVSRCFELLEFQYSPRTGIAEVSVQEGIEDMPSRGIEYTKCDEALQVVVDIAAKLVSRCFDFELSVANQEREKNTALHRVCEDPFAHHVVRETEVASSTKQESVRFESASGKYGKETLRQLADLAIDLLCRCSKLQARIQRKTQVYQQVY